MSRKYRNGKASGDPKRDLKYSPEYLAYRQNRGGESIKVSQCDLDLDGTRDSIVSAWRHPAVGKVEHCGDPYLFWPVTGISTLLNPHSPPTSVQTLTSPQGNQAPTGIGLEIDMDEDGFYAGPDNLPPYDFDDNDDTIGPITLLTLANQGPTGISTIAPLQNANSGPLGISTIAPLQNANSGPTGISLQIDMDEDGVYAPDDFDDNDGSVGIVVPLTSVNSGPTGISLQIDMDEDGVYAPDDYDDNDNTIGNVVPLTLANQGPTGISLQIDMDEDGVYAPDDYDDNDNTIGNVAPEYDISVALYPNSTLQAAASHGGPYDVNRPTPTITGLPSHFTNTTFFDFHVQYLGTASVASYNINANPIQYTSLNSPPSWYFNEWVAETRRQYGGYSPTFTPDMAALSNPHEAVTTVDTNFVKRWSHLLEYDATKLEARYLPSGHSFLKNIQIVYVDSHDDSVGATNILPSTTTSIFTSQEGSVSLAPGQVGISGNARSSITVPQTIQSGGSTLTFTSWDVAHYRMALLPAAEYTFSGRTFTMTPSVAAGRNYFVQAIYT